MPLTPELTPVICAFLDHHAALPHGQRSEAVKAKAGELGVSPQTLGTWMRQAGYQSGRKRRADSGKSCVPEAETFHAANVLRQATRSNGKQLLSIGTSMDLLAGNGLARFERVDPVTGEVRRVAPSTVARAMKLHGLHPTQQRRATPHVTMASEHPNHVRQIDASVCVLYWMRKGALGVMEADEFYKNKPEAADKVKSLVTRYLVVDHYSGAFYLEYFLGNESAQMITDFFIRAISDRGDGDLLRGVPRKLVMDPGVGNKSHLFSAFLRKLDCEPLIHRVRNPRAKGAVEGHHNIIERAFEGLLTFHSIDSLEQLQAYARTWSRHYQSTKIHSRTGHTRYGLWQTIRPGQLRIAPPAAFLYELMTTAPKPCTVRGDLTVGYAIKGYGTRRYSVKDVPGVLVGEKLSVAANPYKLPGVFVLTHDAQGHEQRYYLDPIERNDAGFLATSAGFDGHRSAPDTAADTARKALDVAAYGGTTQEEAQRLRRQRQPAYDGRIDAFSYLENEARPDFIRRPGTDIAITGPVVEAAPLTTPQAFDAMVARGIDVPGMYGRIKALYPEGVPADAIDTLAAALRPMTEGEGRAPALKVISGGWGDPPARTDRPGRGDFFDYVKEHSTMKSTAAQAAPPPDPHPEAAVVPLFPAFRGHPYMPIRLKHIIVTHGISQPELAAAVAQSSGQPLSPTSMSQVINHGYYPRSTPVAAIRGQVEQYLRDRGVPEAEILAAWDPLEGPDTLRQAQPAGHHPNHGRTRAGHTAPHDDQESIEMFLRAEPLLPDTRKAFALFRNPFADDLQAIDDIFQWPDFRYCREALWDAARNGAFRAIVAESGGGKTTLVQDLRERVGAVTESIIVIEPYVVGMEEADSRGTPLKSSAIAESVIRAISPYATLKSSHQARFKQAHDALIESSRAGNRHLLLIEEAHALPIATLKHLKRWRELRDGLRPLLGIALIGQNELKAKLSPNNPAVREVVQRCELVELLPMDEHIEAYVRHRLQRAGRDAAELFDPKAYDAMRTRLTLNGGGRSHAISMCYPLAINNLCVRALNAAAKYPGAKVDAEIVKGA